MWKQLWKWVEAGRLSRYILKICSLRVIGVRPRMEMRNMLLETRGKVILVIKSQRIWLNCLHSSVLWKADPMRDKIGY